MTSPHHHHHHLFQLSSSSNSSSSYSTSSSNSSLPQSRTLEQVWNDITPYAYSTIYPSMGCQNFLTAAPPTAAANPPPSDNLTILQLRPPSFDFRYLQDLSRRPPASATPATDTAATGKNVNFSDELASPPLGVFFPFTGEKSSLGEDLSEGPDRRCKRMMKNRESAARSRARKQAYTNELEAAVKNLTQENAKLKRLHDELLVAMSAQLPTKKALIRTLTAPF